MASLSSSYGVVKISAPVEVSAEPSEVDGDHENVGVWLDGLPVIG